MYETNRHLVNEAKVINEFCSIMNCEKQKLPISQQIDFALCVNRKVVGFAEVKCRIFPHDQYKTMFVGLNKVQKARELYNLTKKRVVLLVSWQDVMGYIDFNEEFELGLGGRKDRGDVNDFGLIAHYPLNKFKILGSSPV